MRMKLSKMCLRRLRTEGIKSVKVVATLCRSAGKT